MRGWRKKTILVVLLVVSGLLFVSCKEKEEKVQEPPQKNLEMENQSVSSVEETFSLYDVNEEEIEGNGKYFVHILDTDPEKRTITFDQARILFVGQDDDKIKELGEDPEEFVSGYYIYNEEEKAQTLALSEKVNINVIDFESDAPATSFKEIDEESFLKNHREDLHTYCYITVKDQEITDIYEQFLP